MSTTIHPIVFLPFHLVSNHLNARCFDAKQVTYPALLLFTLVQFGAEHFTEELPMLASLNAPLVLVGLTTLMCTYYKAYKKTEGPKALVVASFVLFFALFGVFTALDTGLPKDTPAEQAQANLDASHSRWHLLLHIALLFNGLMTSVYVPWSSEPTLPMVPASPKHSTRATSAPSLWSSSKDCPPSPAKMKHM